MKLEKSNETVWSIKRKDSAGKFVLRSTESGGKLVKVSISLVNQKDLEVTFEMNYPEFKNFYGIISSFKELIESPEHLALNQNSLEEIPILENPPNSEKKFEDLDLKAISETLNNLDLGLEAVKSLDPKAPKQDLNIPYIPSHTQKSVTTPTQKKKKLKETDWDPW